MKVSVIIPTYNNGRYIERAIKSVLDQAFSDLELVIINDGSTDNTGEILKKINNPKFKIITHDKNKGIVVSRNDGLSEASGEYIAILDSDDYWTDNNKLKNQAEFLDKNQDFGLVGTLAKAVDTEGNYLFSLNYPTEDKNIRNSSLLRDNFIHSSVLFRKTLLEKIGAYKPEEEGIEDYGMWLRIGEIAKFANLNSYSIAYTINPFGETSTKNVRQIKRCIALIKKHKNSYPNYHLGLIKWFSKIIFVSIFGNMILNKTKKLLATSF